MIDLYREKAYTYIRQYMLDHAGHSPTYQMIADAIGTSSKSSVSNVLADLEMAGKIKVVRLAGAQLVQIYLPDGTYQISDK